MGTKITQTFFYEKQHININKNRLISILESDN